MTPLQNAQVGMLSVNGVGRVGTSRRHSRARHHWSIFEDNRERTDLGSFRSKADAIIFLASYATSRGLTLEGDPNGYPWIRAHEIQDPSTIAKFKEGR